MTTVAPKKKMRATRQPTPSTQMTVHEVQLLGGQAEGPDMMEVLLDISHCPQLVKRTDRRQTTVQGGQTEINPPPPPPPLTWELPILQAGTETMAEFTNAVREVTKFLRQALNLTESTTDEDSDSEEGALYRKINTLKSD